MNLPIKFAACSLYLAARVSRVNGSRQNRSQAAFFRKTPATAASAAAPRQKKSVCRFGKLIFINSLHRKLSITNTQASKTVAFSMKKRRFLSAIVF